jgi:hypothetical protein
MCWTALIQLRFTSKQDLMCSRVCWLERTEKTLSILKFVYNSTSKSSVLTRLSKIEDFFPQRLFNKFKATITLYFLIYI